MSVSGLKAELKFLASIFDKNHERFRIVSWKLDELHCQFLVPPPAPPGSPHSPPPPLTLHCNITVRRPAAAPQGRAGEERGAPSARTKGRLPRRGPSDPGRGGAGPPLFPVRGPTGAPPGLRAAGVGGGGRRGSPAFPAGLGLGLLAPRGPGRRTSRRPSPRWVAMAAHSQGPAPGGRGPRVGCCVSPGGAGERPSSLNASFSSQVSLVPSVPPIIF